MSRVVTVNSTYLDKPVRTLGEALRDYRRETAAQWALNDTWRSQSGPADMSENIRRTLVAMQLLASWPCSTR